MLRVMFLRPADPPPPREPESMVIRLRPCMRSSASLLLSTPPPPLEAGGDLSKWTTYTGAQGRITFGFNFAFRRHFLAPPPLCGWYGDGFP